MARSQMHTDSGMTGISLSGFMPYMTVASLEMSDEPYIIHALPTAHYQQVTTVPVGVAKLLYVTY